MSDFTREIKFTAGYDYRDEPDGRRGAHGTDLWLALRGPLGAICARISTGWMLRPLADSRVVWGQPQERRSKPGCDGDGRHNPSGAYVGAHSYLPRDGFSDDHGSCGWLGGADCYETGGFTEADRVLEALVSGGSDAAFEHLEGLYRSWIVEHSVVEVAP